MSSDTLSAKPWPQGSHVVPTALPRVAQSIYVECKKCGVDRYQKVLFHVTEVSAKLECEVCKTKRSYSLEKAKTAKAKVAKAEKVAKSAVDSTGSGSAAKKLSARKKSTSSATSKKNSLNLWIEFQGKIGSSALTPYSPKAIFKADQGLDHPKFGHGLVVEVQPQSIDVLFEEGVKKLMHQR